MKYLFNSLIVPVDFDSLNVASITLRKATVEDIRKILSGGFVSAVGHEPTAKLLSKILKMDVQYNRAAVKMRSGDVGVHFVLAQRPPEGKVLSEEELAKLDYYFAVSYVLQSEKVQCKECDHELFPGYFNEVFGQRSDVMFCPECGAVYEGCKFLYWLIPPW